MTTAVQPARVGIIGCGLIGKKRADALAGATLVACADPDLGRAQALAAKHKAKTSERWQDVIDGDSELVIKRDQIMLRSRGRMSFGHSSAEAEAEVVAFFLE